MRHAYDIYREITSHDVRPYNIAEPPGRSAAVGVKCSSLIKWPIGQPAGKMNENWPKITEILQKDL
jgi:hypothetical protein